MKVVGLAAAAALLVGAGPARAQRTNTNGSTPQPSHGFQDPRFAPHRPLPGDRTSPFSPNRNPRPVTGFSEFRSFPGTVFGGGIFIGSPYWYGGFGYGPVYGGYQQFPDLYQRQTIIIQPGLDYSRLNPQGNASPADGAAKPGPSQGPAADDQRNGDGYYLGGKQPAGESISDALDDIRKAWLNGDIERLSARFKTDGTVRIYPNGQFKSATPAREFVAMLKDAMTRIDTVAFEFDRPKAGQEGKAFVTGKHTFIDTDQKKVETYISYGLELVGGKWKITEAGSSAAPIAKHTD